MAPSTIARDTTTDPHFMLLYYALKYIDDGGKPNFAKVAESMGLDTANAAAKRYARLMKVQDGAEGGTGGGSGGYGAAKGKATPRKGAGKKKGLSVDVDDGGADGHGDGVGNGSLGPRKKQRLSKAKKSDAMLEKLVEAVDGAMEALRRG